MGYSVSIKGYKDILEEIAERIYTSRREFLGDHFDGYVQDTYYFVPDDGYYCWPIHSEGRFEGFTDPTSGEETALKELEEVGFEYLGTGVNRIAYECPPDVGEDLVVKFGRCGMGDGYGAGREKNLIEYQISTAIDDVPIVPNIYCDPMGRYAIYPKADLVEESELHRSTVSDLTRAVTSKVSELRCDELGKIGNFGWLKGEVRVLDYCEFEGYEYPGGVPKHVDPEPVIRKVDELRRQGKKQDIEAPGKMATPRIASE